MRIIINDERGRECKNLEKFWLLTKEKLERSDHDFELSFNRLYFIARSKIGLLSADVIDNVLFYLSVMYKACYHGLCILQAYDTFLKKIMRADVEALSEVTIALWYYRSFQDGNLQEQVSKELFARFSEVLCAQPEKSTALKAFFDDNNIILLKLIAYLNHLSIGYQTGGETKRRAYLFAKLLRLIREALQRQTSQHDAVTAENTKVSLEQVNIDSITPNLKLKIDLFDFGICFKTGAVITSELALLEERYKNIDANNFLDVPPEHIPNELRIISTEADVLHSLRYLFAKGILYLSKDYHSCSAEMDSQVYLASIAGSIMWRLTKKVLKKCMRRWG